MTAAFDGETLGAMCAVRLAFDPGERANPGKVYPTHACKEWGRAGSNGASRGMTG
jgi:hypothetical protein